MYEINIIISTNFRAILEPPGIKYIQTHVTSNMSDIFRSLFFYSKHLKNFVLTLKRGGNKLNTPNWIWRVTVPANLELQQIWILFNLFLSQCAEKFFISIDGHFSYKFSWSFNLNPTLYTLRIYYKKVTQIYQWIYEASEPSLKWIYISWDRLY